MGTHNVKHMNNVKLVHVKETSMASFLAEAITQEQSNREMLQKYAINSQKSTHTEVQIQPKLERNLIEITVLQRCSPYNPPHALRTAFHKNTSAKMPVISLIW